jgi:hypothetical protein
LSKVETKTVVMALIQDFVAKRKSEKKAFLDSLKEKKLLPSEEQKLIKQYDKDHKKDVKEHEALVERYNKAFNDEPKSWTQAEDPGPRGSSTKSTR